MRRRSTTASEKKSKTEKVVFWVGSICGIVISLFTIYEKATAPSDPRLTITFFESASSTLRLFPSTDTAIEQTEDIPLQLKIANTGGRATKNLKLYLSHYVGVTLTTKYKKEEKRTWNSPNDAMKQLSLTLEDLNPGESFLIPISVKLDFPRDFQIAVRAPSNDVSDKSLIVPRGYPIYCDISSDTSPNTRTILEIILGSPDMLKRGSQDVFWIGHGPEGVHVLKMKDDFPTN